MQNWFWTLVLLTMGNCVRAAWASSSTTLPAAEGSAQVAPCAGPISAAGSSQPVHVIPSGVHIRATSIHATAESLALQGDVYMTYGDCVLRTSQALLHGVLSSDLTLDQLDCPELHVEWLNGKGHLCRMECSGPCHALFGERRAILTAADGQRLEWSDEELRVEARMATVWSQTSQWQMDRLHLQGDVRMYRRYPSGGHGPSQLSAETAEIFIAEKVVVLTAERPASVMLWNRGASQELACQRLRIWKDPLTQEWIQEGEGGVKITLTGDVVHRMAHSLHDREDEDDDDDADF